jgi:hypothetical protein
MAKEDGVRTAQRELHLRLYGLAEVRREVTEKKRITRMRASFRKHGVEPVVMHDGIPHEVDCACYDCLYGEVARLRAMARSPRRDLVEPEPMMARTGRAHGGEAATRRRAGGVKEGR